MQAAGGRSNPVCSGAAVYMLKHVLRGCRDAEAIKILKNCCAVIPADGSLLVIEFILPPLISQANPRLEGHLMSDLNMLPLPEAESEVSTNGEQFSKQRVFA